jgi:lysophospholipase L1-like esterase
VEKKITKKWPKRKLFLYSIFAIIAFFIFLEFIFRLICYFEFSPFHTNYSIQGNSRWISDSDLVWTNRPFYLEYDKHSQYNELGIRVEAGDVFMPVKKEDDFWVFLFGGSAMAGMGSNKDGDWIDITGVNDHPINQSIDGYLRNYLQKAMPHKKVRVFNTAVSGHTIYQSFIHYQLLCKHKPDWIISMDGINDPKSLATKETTLSYIQNQWKADPGQNSLFGFSKLLMSHSAFLNKLYKYIYFKHELIRTNENTNSSWKIKNKWTHEKNKKIAYTNQNPDIINAVKAFNSHLTAFTEKLEEDKQNHILLIQPYASLRDTNKLIGTEKAVYNYFTNFSNKDTTNTFIKILHEKTKEDFKFDSKVFSMNAVHHWNGWVFVDYCHFTKEANKRIAREIFESIISNGNYIPFEN